MLQREINFYVDFAVICTKHCKKYARGTDRFVEQQIRQMSLVQK